MFASLGGWVDLAKLKLTFAKINRAKTVECALIMKMPTTANAPKATVVTTVNTLDRYAIETLVNMAVHVSAIQVDMTDIPVFVQREQLENTVKRIPEMSVHMIPAKMELNVLTELVILIVTVLLNLEVCTKFPFKWIILDP